MTSFACVIPIHGRITLLRACIDSLVAQTLPPAEIVVVSDHNSDADEARIIEMCAAFPRVRVIKNAGARGAAAARNCGIKATAAPLILCVDADVVFEPDACAALVQALEKNAAAAFAYGDFMFGTHHMRGQPFSVAALQKENFISTMSLVRRSAFPGFDESLRRFQDWDVWLTIAEQGGQGIYVPQILFHVLFGGGMSSWLPAFVVKHAQFFTWIPRVKKYVAAKKIILQKHR